MVMSNKKLDLVVAYKAVVPKHRVKAPKWVSRNNQ